MSRTMCGASRSATTDHTRIMRDPPDYGHGTVTEMACAAMSMIQMWR
jgi:hypothetical protein